MLLETCEEDGGAPSAEGGPSTPTGLPPVPPEPARVSSERESVVKIFSIYTAPNWYYPWQNAYQRSSTSSGFLATYKGRRLIICNAHGVKFASSIRVRKNGIAKKWKATLLHISHEADLAILDVSNPLFWKANGKPDGPDVNLLEFGGLPDLRAEVTVLGYPKGGDSLSITKGVVSRIEVIVYSHSHASLPAIQTDAAINSGNSGGPALLDGKVVGAAFSKLKKGQNIGYVIPWVVIKFFLDSLIDESVEEEKGDSMFKEAKFCGYGTIGLATQKLENDCIRKFLKVEDRSGIRIKKLNPLSHAAEVLEVDDCVLSLDGVEIGNDATMVLRTSERVQWIWFIALKVPGTYAKFRILRNGEEMDLDVKIAPLDNSALMVPRHLHDKKPHYFVWGGLVVSNLSFPLLNSAYGRDWRQSLPGKMKYLVSKHWREKPDEEIVVLVQILDHEVNLNYDSMSWDIIEKINGEEILNLADLFTKICAIDTEFVRLDLCNNGTIILPKIDADKSSAKIKKDHRMFSLMSDSLKHIPGASELEKCGEGEEEKDPLEDAAKKKEAETTE